MTPDGTGIALHDVTVSVVVYFLAVLTLTAFAASRLAATIAAVRRARAARRRFSEPAPAELHAGPVDLTGTVETEPPDTPAITVRLRQRAFSAGIPRNPALDWKEQERTVEARPFSLVLPGTGVRVEVLPGERPHLLARSLLTVTESGERVLSASLQHGESACVTGVLAAAADEDAAGYREAPHRFALQAAEGERLRVEAASATLLPDAVEGVRRRALRQMTRMLLVGCGAPALWTTLMLAQSTTVTATVTHAGTCSGRSKSGRYEYPCFTALAPGGQTSFDHLQGQATVGAPVRISFVRGLPSFFDLGETLDPDVPSVVFMGVSSLMLALVIAIERSRHEKRWYEVEPFDSREAP